MKKILMLVGMVIALSAVKASAYSAQFLGAGKKANSRSVDANGNPLEINDDKPWKVFEVTDMYVGLMMIALLGYLFQLAMGWLERRLLRWKPAATAMKGTP